VGLTFALLGAAWFVGWYLCARVPTLPLLDELVPEPSISVVIPARNEADVIAELLAALTEQTRPAAEVIVVDDESEDATAEVAHSAYVRVIRVRSRGSTARPAGWTGKAWAMWLGARAATSDVVVFLDADTHPESTFLARLGALYERVGGLVSVQPYHRTETVVEKLSALFNVVAVMGVGLSTLLPNARQTGAFGPCLVCSRVEFLRHGDHRTVRSAVLEDVALASRFRSDGETVQSFAGGDVVSFRMYRGGFRDLVRGWGKNFAAGAASVALPRLVAIVVWITALLVSGAVGVRAVVDVVAGDSDGGTTIALGLYLAFAVQLWLMFRQVGNFGVLAAALYPIVALVFVAIFAWSLIGMARGEVRWKGRTLRLRSGRAP
jgi:4,4'-diaponeurosporenoate glycosyltransferase